ncbi:S8 family peptidase [Clostridium tepidiprofundi]|uniref:S8 family peptidase n=1 Tax=Clostridium tepidiprofundi TaxID=420412 RepID=UPI001FA7ADD0|nr:S8 family peptidase [Clostridium tepidiprofundi]
MEVYYTKNSNALLNLLLMVPDRVKNKLIKYSKNEELLKRKIELIVIITGNSDNVNNSIESFGGTFEYLGYGFGIITMDADKINLVANIPEIIYFQLPKALYTDYIESNKESCVVGAWEQYNLSGKGVLIGFIDSGIDYTHPAFINQNGTSRIEYIYDIKSNKVWNNAEINKALNSENPYPIVPERDDMGHGTHVAGIACAGGKVDKKYYGVAYESSIIMVKMTRTGKVNYTKDSQIMRAIKFLVDKSIELKKPLVINLSFSTNDGAHDGKSLLEQYIKIISAQQKISFVVAAGNEGDRAHHVGGVLKEVQTINMNIAEDETAIILQLYKNLMDDISIRIKNPAGKTTNIMSINRNYYSGYVGIDNYYIYNTGATPISLNGEIVISLVPENEFLQSGIWSIEIYSNSKQKNHYDIWMPISEGLNDKTKFLKPNPYNTLGIPATVENVIAVGSYNYNTDTISPFSGRGRLSSDIKKPDILSPGEDIFSSIPGGGFDMLSGTSMAAPEVAGAAALLMEWGVVQGKDAFMYGERLKYFLLKGAKRDRTDINYPNPLWGYGTLCVRNSLEVWNNEGGRDLGYRAEENINQSMYLKEGYDNFIVEYEGDIKSAFKNINFASVYVLDENYAVISVESSKKQQLYDEVKEVVYIERTVLYTLNSISPIDAANISKFHDHNHLTLRGRGVLVGILDTGIDYLNKEFIYEDDTTRIVSIWDQSINTGLPPEGFDFGSEYDSNQINKAITKQLENGNPYEIVPSKDENGHGTEIAGIIGARGRNGVMGAAPDCEFVVVKLLNAKESILKDEGLNDIDKPIYSNTSIILGIKYLLTTAKRLNKPIVISLAVGTNFGSHNGTSLVERYINEISKVRGIAVVSGTGNQGDSDTHTEGKIEKTGDIKTVEIKIDDFQKSLKFEIWCSKPDKISLGIVSPSGEVIEKIPARIQEVEEIKFIFEGSSVFVKYYLPEEITGDELICVNIKNAKGGIWQIRLIGDYVVEGRYYIWLPQRELLKEQTRFLNPSPYTTLTIPSTSRRLICCATYNQNNNTLVAFSGRGYTRDGRIKPDVAVGGINVVTTGLNNQIVTVTGSSAASAVLSGAVALMLQWGIVDGNDKTLYSTKIMTYLIRGTDKRKGDIYPNREWGYGMLDLNGVFKNMRAIEKSRSVFIDIPEEVRKKINI